MFDSWVLVSAAAMAAATHSLLPDHWIPFVAAAKGARWSIRQTMRVTGIGAMAHLLSTMILGILTAFLGAGVAGKVGEQAETIGGFIVLAFGLYFIIRGLQGGSHAHCACNQHHHHGAEADQAESSHSKEGAADYGQECGHGDHQHEHFEPGDHGHEDGGIAAGADLKPAAATATAKGSRSDLYIGALLGGRPCAEAIPIFLAASTKGVFSSLLAVGIWLFVTVVTMLGVVWISVVGLENIKLGFLERYGQVVSGGVILVVGTVMIFLG